LDTVGEFQSGHLDGDARWENPPRNEVLIGLRPSSSLIVDFAHVYSAYPILNLDARQGLIEG
jgi:hypothetical protein